MQIYNRSFKMINQKSNIGIEEEDIEQIIKVFIDNDKIAKAILFGSRAKGNFQPGSDIDIALFGENLTINDVIDLKIAFDELDFPYKVDFVIYDRIKELSLKEHINRVGLPLFER